MTRLLLLTGSQVILSGLTATSDSPWLSVRLNGTVRVLSGGQPAGRALDVTLSPNAPVGVVRSSLKITLPAGHRLTIPAAVSRSRPVPMSARLRTGDDLAAGDVWTAARVAAVIEKEWQVAYHPGYVAELLHACGWSRQKPARRARQRDEGAVQEWQDVRLPALKKRP